MIDKNGKIFGIVNTIDFLTLVLVLLAAAFLYTKLKKSPEIVNENVNKLIEVKFFSEEVADFVTDIIKIGDRLEDESKNIFLGEITDIKTDRGYTYVYDKDGNGMRSYKEGYKCIEITAKVNAQIFENGIIIDGNKYGVGHSLTIRAGKGKIYGRISGLDIIN